MWILYQVKETLKQKKLSIIGTCILIQLVINGSRGINSEKNFKHIVGLEQGQKVSNPFFKGHLRMKTPITKVDAERVSSIIHMNDADEVNDVVDLKFNFATKLDNEEPGEGKAKKVRQENVEKGIKESEGDDGRSKDDVKVKEELKGQHKNIHPYPYENNDEMTTAARLDGELDQGLIKKSVPFKRNKAISEENKQSSNSQIHTTKQRISNKYHKRKIIISRGVNQLHKHSSNVNNY